MGTIRVHTANEIIVFDNKPIITSGNKNINDISVTFCDKWLSLGENTEYWAVFFKDEKEIHKRKLKNGKCLIPNEVLTKKGWFYFGFYSEAENGEKVKTSKIAEFEVTQGVPIDNNGESEIDIAVNSAKEEYRNELETSIETATGENHDNKTWEELNETVSTLPIISEEQTQALGDWDLIKEYFKNYTGPFHHLFNMAPKDADGKDIPYRLPYIYTPKMKWNASSSAFSTSLLEVGIDVSSAQTIGSATATRPFTSQTLERLIMTGNANATTLQNFMYNASALQYIKLDTPSEDVLNLNPSYYGWAFYRCEKLQTIDCELDFTGQTDTKNMFRNCFYLKKLRIKPFTLRCSLNVADCRYFIHPDIKDTSLLSILNAIPNPKTAGENAEITITYSNYGWTFETMGEEGIIPAEFITTEVYFNSETGLYSYEKQTESDEKMTMFEAFEERKGVTLAI